MDSSFFFLKIAIFGVSLISEHGSFHLDRQME